MFNDLLIYSTDCHFERLSRFNKYIVSVLFLGLFKQKDSQSFHFIVKIDPNKKHKTRIGTIVVSVCKSAVYAFTSEQS